MNTFYPIIAWGAPRAGSTSRNLDNVVTLSGRGHDSQMLSTMRDYYHKIPRKSDVHRWSRVMCNHSLSVTSRLKYPIKDDIPCYPLLVLWAHNLVKGQMWCWLNSHVPSPG